MTDRLAGKRALVTAAAQGIGRATAIAFAAEGADVLATDINQDTLAMLAGDCPAVRTRILDVTDAVAIAAAAVEPFDILFNCAGWVANGSILEAADSDLERSWDINLVSMARMIKAVLPGMIERGCGSIVNVASVASSIIGVPGRFAYGTTKAAIIGLTKSVAVDFVGQGIRCNAICPGTVHTPSLDARIAAFADPDVARAQFIARQPMGRLGKPGEIAALAIHLASDESSYTTGSVYVVDGGWTAA